ncbi:MAG TPA: 5-oxoprolinase subunit PxpA [Chthoniobacterales bacterium]|nr:5-oxoprolinase subunit PxpA [Chthoniobacterales bacterium]
MKLNADLGEHEPPERTAALMALIDLANVACGGHAGTPDSMKRAVELSLQHGVRIGAHPGLATDFGRGKAAMTMGDLQTLVARQIDTLATIAAEQRVALHHIKLHGALYHAVENSGELARGFVGIVHMTHPELKIVSLAGGRVADFCRELGVESWPEAFAERGYREDGSLVPRGEPGDLIVDPAEVARRVRTLVKDGVMATASGGHIRVEARTVCVHSDTPNAVEIARAVREVLGPRD